MTVTYTDVRLTLQYAGSSPYYDLSFASTGDFEMTAGMDTALYMSLLINARASETEIPSPRLRGGWAGNLYLNQVVGSKLWILFGSTLNSSTASLAISYTQVALSWLTSNNYADKLNISSETIGNTGLNIVVEILKDGTVLSQKAFNAWQATLKDYANVN